MSDSWSKFGTIFAGLGIVLAILTFATPEVRCFFKLPSDVCANNCNEQLSRRIGHYEGKAVIVNSPTKRSGTIIVDISRETDNSCRLIVLIEELPPLSGKGTLDGEFDSKLGQKVNVSGSVSHPSKPKVWDVEMTILFTDDNKIKGQSTWKPRIGIEDRTTYYEEFTATKSF